MQGMCDPILEYKRKEVTRRAEIFTPLQALTPEERDHFVQMVRRIFVGYDADQSGTLEFGEFRRCLTESQLGLSDKQISYLMSVSDADSDGVISYSEFSDLFFDALIELARMEAIERELSAEDAADTATQLLDALMIPVHIMFDLECDGAEDAEGSRLAAALEAKALEWNLSVGIDPIATAIREKDRISWPELITLFKSFAPASEAEAEAETEDEGAPTGDSGDPAPAPEEVV
eukprot:CAMPEP_0181225792 /NCGR_PEP_ID=MMETSP1096-20121128/31896_1 /TAXON_ID=156174 ORGANISM="Chrysochromulina ericina, Strain CCMP281" /NCGR_SAMPLE_ID=MMETSP1096 /ASSEMBLY_ACC=CAM_ASM_000453 /LENGTH=232 /DNA_ID=CAMNT_0023319059 /DNA_START=1 /DNA_END=699 /DNA_ORIENTATION=-